MLMATTKVSDIINPEVMGPMIDAKIDALAKITPYAKVDTTIIIFVTSFFNDNKPDIKYISEIIIYVVCGLMILITIFLLISFYKVFFRLKKNYKVMPTVDIRMFHFFIHRNQLLGTDDEKDLYNYLVDSYLFCSFENARVNTIRESALIVYDNLATVCFILCVFEYIFMKIQGYSIDWIF